MAKKTDARIEKLAQSGYVVPQKWATYPKNSEEEQLAASTDRDENGRPLPSDQTEPAGEPAESGAKAAAGPTENKAAAPAAKKAKK